MGGRSVDATGQSLVVTMSCFSATKKMIIDRKGPGQKNANTKWTGPVHQPARPGRVWSGQARP